MNAPKATELRQAKVAPAERLSRYRENLGVSTKSKVKIENFGNFEKKLLKRL